MIMRQLYTFFFVFFFALTSFGQSFSISELIKMAKMDVDTFDSYVTSKGFAFHLEENDNDVQGLEYAFEISKKDLLRAEKFITLYQRYFNYRYAIHYQTLSKKEYVNIKNQIKVLGFKLKDSGIYEDDDGTASTHFEYIKGNATISIFADYKTYEINYMVSNN
jgi:hypothetical protein